MRVYRSSGWLAVGIVLASVQFTMAAETTAKPMQIESLPGFVPAPKRLPGIGRWQMAHRYPAGEIYSVAWSPDGKRLACSDLNNARICNAQTFETEAVLIGHSGRVMSVDWNRRNKRIASAGSDGTVRIWSADAVPLKVFKSQSGGLHAVAWRNDGSRLAAAGEDGRVRIWLADGSAGPAFDASESAINCLAWSPDGEWLVTGDNNNLVKLWKADGSPGPIGQGHRSRVTDVVWSPDGKYFASSTWGYKPPSTETYFADLRMWKADGTPAGTLDGAMADYGITWSPDSRHLAVISEGGQIRIVSPDAKLESTRPVPQRLLTAGPLAWSPDGQEIASGGSGMLCVLHVSDGAIRQSPRLDAADSTSNLPSGGVPNPHLEEWIVRTSADAAWRVFSDDGTPGPAMPRDVPADKVSNIVWNPIRDEIAFVENGVRVRTWTLGSASTRLIKEYPESITTLEWSPDGETLAVADQSTMRFLRSDGTPVFERKLDGPSAVRGANRDASAVRFASKGEKIAIVEPEKIIVARRDGTPLETVTFEPPVDKLLGNWLWWSADGARMTTLRRQGEKGGDLMTRDLQRRTSRKLSDFPDEIVTAACSPDGKLLLAGYNGGEWALHDLDRPDVPSISTLAHVNGTVLATAFSPDGQQFATGGWDDMIHIWSLDGSLRQSLVGHGTPVQSLTWSTDGKRLLSRARDGSMRVWSLAAGRPELIFWPLIDGTWLMLTDDGRRVGGSDSGIARTFLFLREQPSGAMQIVDYATFLKQAGLVSPGHAH